MCSRGGRMRHHAALLIRHFPLPTPAKVDIRHSQPTRRQRRAAARERGREMHSPACHPCLPRLRQPLLVVAALRKQACAPSSPPLPADCYFDGCTTNLQQGPGVGATVDDETSQPCGGFAACPAQRINDPPTPSSTRSLVPRQITRTPSAHLFGVPPATGLCGHPQG